MTAIEIDHAFEGANPFRGTDIRQIDPRTFELLPFCEDEMVAYKFRLDLRLLNKGNSVEEVDLIVNWGDETYKQLRDTLYLQTNGNKWGIVKGRVNGKKITATIDLPPGSGHLTLNPKYDIKDHNRFLISIPEDRHLKKINIGTTPGNRPIWIIKAGLGGKTILISARVHPYETAPSYIMEGIIDYLESTTDSRTLNEYNFVIIPMAAPDGVAEGSCRISSLENGVDLSREVNLDNRLTQIYLKLIDEIKPALYLELHNWMFKDIDGMFYLNGYDSFRLKNEFEKRMYAEVKKKWEIGLNFPFRAKKPGGLKRYCKQVYRSKVLTLEIPWFGRTTQDMREFGRIVPLSLIKLL